MTRSVRWTESVQAMIGAGAQMFVEIGSKDVLTNLLKRIDSSAAAVNLSTVAALEAFVDSD